jgi:RND superfamily putative drug exporter
MTDSLGIPKSSITVVFSSDSLFVGDTAYADAVTAALAPLEGFSEVGRITTFFDDHDPFMVSPDLRTTYALVRLNTDIDSSVDLYPRLRDRIQSDVLDIWVTGGIAIFSDLNDASENDLRRAEIVTLPLVLIALVIIFGGVVAAGLPVAMGIVSVVMTLALVYLLGQRMDMSIFVLNIASFLGLGMAVDYSLLMVSRFREELERREVADAVAVTCATAGKAILFSGATTVIALSGLLFFKFMMLRSLGVGGVTVILFSMLLAMSLVPALLSALGHRVDSLSVLPRRRARGRFWAALAGWVMRRPLAVIVPVGAGLLLLGVPFLDVRPGTPWASILPEGAESREGWDVVVRDFGPGELAPIIVISTSAEGVLTSRNIDAAYEFARRLQSEESIVRVSSIVTVSPEITPEQYRIMYASASRGPPGIARAVDAYTNDAADTSIMYVTTSLPPTAEAAKELVRGIRAQRPGGGLETFVTGATADLMDTTEQMYSDFPKVIVYVLVATYAALFMLFRSVLLPLKAVILNVMSILASFGALVFVFQQGHFQSILGFQSEGFTEATVPILLFCIVFGLSMDYEVFLLSRVKEEYDAGGDNTAAVATGMERSGRIITSAALVMVLVSAGFATGDILIVKALGFGTALAIFIDSTIVRALLAPALMRVFGDANWWAPRFLGQRP